MELDVRNLMPAPTRVTYPMVAVEARGSVERVFFSGHRYVGLSSSGKEGLLLRGVLGRRWPLASAMKRVGLGDFLCPRGVRELLSRGNSQLFKPRGEYEPSY